jgi:5-formyltetrahydrofolate cyclo-ligase
MDAEKNALRHRIRASRAARSAGDRAASDAAIAERGIALAERSGVRTLACYLSGSTEPPTRSLIALATARGIRVLLPVVRPGRVLDWAEDDGSERTTRLGVHEPISSSRPRALSTNGASASAGAAASTTGRCQGRAPGSPHTRCSMILMWSRACPTRRTMSPSMESSRRPAR